MNNNVGVIEKTKKLSLVSEEINIAGVTIRKGDKVEVGFGRRNIIGTFHGFDKVLYAISIKSDDGNITILPYKSIKYVKVGVEEDVQG